MKQTLLILMAVALMGCGSPQGINQTSKAQVGAPIWEFKTGGEVSSSPAIGPDGTIYVGSDDNKLLCHQDHQQRPSQKPVAGEFKQALEVAQQIEDAKLKANALREIINHLRMISQ